MAALWLAGTAATVAAVSSLRPVYNAEALILVESQKIPENFVAATVQTALEARLDTLKQQVLSHERLWNLIQEFDLYSEQRHTRTREEVVQMMRDDINIRLERGWSASRPGAFRVEYETFDPTIVAEVANRIGRFFIDENLRERAAEAAGTSEFLDSQLEESKKTLQAQEDKLKNFKQAYLGELPQQEGVLLAAMSQNRTELAGIQDSLARAQQNKLVLESSLAVAQDNLKRQQELTRLRVQQDAAAPAEESPATASQPAPPTELERAQAQLRALRLRYEDKHPEVQRMLGEVARLEREEKATRAAAGQSAAPPAASPRMGQVQETRIVVPRKETVVGDDSAIRTLRSQIALAAGEIETLEARRRRLVQEATDLLSRMQKLPIREEQLASITRDYETGKANYQSLLNKKLAADVAANMERRQKAERFVMLDAARVPEKPVRPRRELLAAAGSIASLLAAGALAFLLELRKNVVLGEWELPAGTAIVGRVPHMEIKKV
jgi:polysaccharide chain length determinant protein (PEP-CTERM system associated)